MVFREEQKCFSAGQLTPNGKQEQAKQILSLNWLFDSAWNFADILLSKSSVGGKKLLKQGIFRAQSFKSQRTKEG